MNCSQTAEMIRKKGDSQGFSLLEVMIAIALFSVGIMGVGAMQITSTSGNTGARIHTEEYTWVVDQIERLSALNYDAADLAQGTRSVVQGPYTLSWTVVDDSPVAGAKRVAVTATGSHYRARPITIDFIKAR
jgi:prepilin-type N-terminal cleavage/methylation domain-containing protein